MAKLKICLVDDEQDILDVFRPRFEAEGYEVCVAHDGEDALRVISEEMPDLVLLDINMPNLNGYQTCERLRTDRRTMQLPVVMLTVYEELKDREEAAEKGATFYIAKSTEPAQIVRRVNLILRRDEEKAKMAGGGKKPGFFARLFGKS